ncbi:hypothetical protein BDY19DRAFT_922663 [Irpex rosettiformis]|uniref:Uncharacterized protein n=1 Tax=Irpex rosettiformis TaxID=378272 RepID=A0ACB8UHP1_9APHY|nr:hypothetical protein BDY19DRAFT_922663 [Irpex rosettiformis]
MVTEVHIHPHRSRAVSDPLAGGLAAGTTAAAQPGFVTGPATGVQYPITAPATTAVAAPPTAVLPGSVATTGLAQPAAATTVVQGGSGVGVPPVTVVQGTQAQAPLGATTGLSTTVPTTTVVPGGVAATGGSTGLEAGVGGTLPAATMGGVGAGVPVTTAAGTTGLGVAPMNVSVVPPTTVAAGGVGTAGLGAGVATATQPIPVATGNVGGAGIPTGGGIGAGYGGGVGGYGPGMGAGYGAGMGADYGTGLGTGAGIGAAGVRPTTSQRLAGGLQQLGGYLADNPEMVLRGQARRAGMAPVPSTTQEAAVRGDVAGGPGVLPPAGGGQGRYFPGVGPTYY